MAYQWLCEASTELGQNRQTLPEAARGAKMFRVPPSEAGTTQPHNFSQNSLTRGVSTVFSVMLSPVDKRQYV